MTVMTIVTQFCPDISQKHASETLISLGTELHTMLTEILLVGLVYLLLFVILIVVPFERAGVIHIKQ